jgi:hypothetical protein
MRVLSWVCHVYSPGFLHELVKAGVLEYKEENGFRWNQAYRGSWEG